MKKKNAVAIFEGQKIRRHWDSDKEVWYFSAVDVVRVLTDSVDAGAYWRKLKQRLKEEGSEVVTKCHGLKMMAPDGKMRLTDVADTEISEYAEQEFIITQTRPIQTPPSRRRRKRRRRRRVRQGFLQGAGGAKVRAEH